MSTSLTPPPNPRPAPRARGATLEKDVAMALPPVILVILVNLRVMLYYHHYLFKCWISKEEVDSWQSP
jgi:hypothetical protein